MDETRTKIVGRLAGDLPAIDGRGQEVDVEVSQRRATADAIPFFRRAIESTGIIPDEVTTDRAAAYPPAPVAALPPVAHETGKRPRRGDRRAVVARDECDRCCVQLL